MMLRAGDWVEVRSKQEILRSLDKRGRLEELPFMPQMFRYCGQRLKVYKRAHKTCDTINDYHGRRLSRAVHLEVRCDGEDHGGCQADCLLFWKEDWLKPVASDYDSVSAPSSREAEDLSSRCDPICTEEDIKRATSVVDEATGETRYVCQATELPQFTTPLPWWDARQYIEDHTSGNVSLLRMCHGFTYAGFYMVYKSMTKSWWRFGSLLSGIYDRFQSAIGGLPFPRKEGRISGKTATPIADLSLQPGDLVRVKSYQEILATLNEHNKNRGLAFDAEMVPYCGGTYRVRTRLNKFIEEKSGKMVTVKHPAIILENVWCQARYSDCRLFCPRSIYSWWREVWLERLPQAPNEQATASISPDTAGMNSPDDKLIRGAGRLK